MPTARIEVSGISDRYVVELHSGNVQEALNGAYAAMKRALREDNDG